MTEFQLPARQPFSFFSTVRSHGWFQLAPFVWDEAAPALGYLLRLSNGKVFALCLSAAPEGANVAVYPQVGSAEQEEIARVVSWMLALDMDFSKFYTLAAGEPKLHRAVAQAMGRVLRSPTLYEDVIRTILTTNTLWAATRRMVANLVEQFGDPLAVGSAGADPAAGEPPVEFTATLHPLRRAFPTPARLAASDEATLREQTRLGYRAPYILDISRRVASGDLDLEALKGSDLPTPELRKRLLAIKGVGGYAVSVLLNILGRYDSIPVDSWALKMVSQEWHAGQPVGRAEVEAAFAGWGEWQGLAYWFWEWKE